MMNGLWKMGGCEAGKWEKGLGVRLYAGLLLLLLLLC